MKFITLFAGALVATTAANVLLSSDAYAAYPPNGWTQKGKTCYNEQVYESTNKSTVYAKLKKSSGIYGVYNKSGNKWVSDYKGVSLEEANTKMNSNCGLSSY
jgi:hypothetical protein